jgi:DNA-binding NarL/FixJ family response regulator
MRILIVEDDAIVAMHLAMLLTELGHEICGTAASAATAIDQAANRKPDIVLMDIRLAQGSNGIEAARELHARHCLRCIFLSANLDEQTKRALLPYQPIGFVGKPVLPILLVRALEKAQQTLTDL